MKKEINLDQIFKDGLSKAEDNIAYRNDDWDAMEKLLDEEKKRRGFFIYRLPVIIGTIAALLLLTLGFFFLHTPGKPTSNTIVKLSKPIKGSDNNNSEHNDTGNATQAINSASSTSLSTHSITNNNLTSAQQLAGTKQNKRLTKRNNRAGSMQSTPLTGFGNDEAMVSSPKPGNLVVADQAVTARPKEQLTELSAVNGSASLTDSNNLNIAELTATDKQLNDKAKAYVAAVKQKQKSGGKGFTNPHPVILSILSAPDINGVGNSFSRGQVGTTSGLTLAVGLTRKITISTGALYAKKPYMIGFSQYNNTNYNFKVQPVDVYADCRVLDIPLNIDYRLYSRGGNQFNIGTGISSYFMLNEKYHFDYNTTGSYTGPSDYQISNKNQHLFGVLNINATYQRRINEKFGLNVQPYMKLPLTNIGYGKVNLQSTGVAVGVSWYLTSNHPR